MNAYVSQDLADLRFAFLADAQFASAIEALTHELARAIAAPSSWGKPLEHGLTAWRRSAFPSSLGGDADLRLIFRPHGGNGIDVLAFGARYHPDTTSIYHIAQRRA